MCQIDISHLRCVVTRGLFANVVTVTASFVYVQHLSATSFSTIGLARKKMYNIYYIYINFCARASCC